MTVSLKESCEVRVRIPEFVDAGEMRACSGADEIDGRAWGNYLELGPRKAGETLRVTYPVPTSSEEISIGHPGFRQYHYRVSWKGDTVAGMVPVGTEYETGYSDFDHKQVPVFYGVEGPGPLYLRKHMLEPTEPELAPIHQDCSDLDFWHIG